MFSFSPSFESEPQDGGIQIINDDLPESNFLEV